MRWNLHTPIGLWHPSRQRLGWKGQQPAGVGQGYRPVKYSHRRVTFIASLKRLWKTAQLEPLGSRRGTLAGSLSTVVGEGGMAEAGDEAEDMLAGVDFGEIGETALERGTKELAGLLVVAGRAGPITYCKY